MGADWTLSSPARVAVLLGLALVAGCGAPASGGSDAGALARVVPLAPGSAPVPGSAGVSSATPVEAALTEPDPAWALRTLRGDRVELGDLRGRPVFVNFWATWCPPCVQELASIQSLARQLDRNGVDATFLLVSAEDAPIVRGFAERYGLYPEPVLEETLAPEAFGDLVLPTTAILDGNGRIVFRYRGAADWSAPEVVAYMTRLAAESGA